MSRDIYWDALVFKKFFEQMPKTEDFSTKNTPVQKMTNRLNNIFGIWLKR